MILNKKIAIAAVIVLCVGCSNEVISSGSSPLVSSDEARQYMPQVCPGVSTSQDFMRAIQSENYTLVTLDSLEILGEETLTQTTSSGIYESQGFRVSLAQATNRVSSGAATFTTAIVSLDETLNYFRFADGAVLETEGCEAGLSSRVRSMASGRIALLIELTGVHGPMVRAAAAWDGLNLGTLDGALTLRELVQSARLDPAPAQREVVPEWYEE